MKQIMKTQSELWGSRKSFGTAILRCFFVAATALIVAASGCTLNNPAAEESQKAAMREMQEVAEITANLLNVYMDARLLWGLPKNHPTLSQNGAEGQTKG